MSASTRDGSDPRKTITVTLDATALDRLESAGQDPRRLAERALRAAVTRMASAEGWEAENRAAIERYNARVESAGPLNDSLRRFVVASLTDSSHEIVNAIDFLHQGY